MKHLVTLPEFETSLFASEPDIIKPLWLAFDERGRLWIAESVDYPNTLQPDGEGHDRLKICEDTDGDGKADKFTLFCDKLSIPTSFGFANGGVIVIHSGKTEFFKDTHGDDQADERTYSVAYTGARVSSPAGATGAGRRAAAQESRAPSSLDKATPTQLVAALRNDNLLWRLHAQRLLVERGARDSIPALVNLTAARDRSDILMEILDPNRSAEANYRLWSVTTKDGDTFSGRLEAETQTTVEILDTAAQKHVVQRKDIASLDASELSIMPTGFEALPPDDLKALIQYLAQPH